MPPSERKRHLGRRLADPGKDDLFGRDAGGTGAAIFPARDDVGTEPKCREGCEHRAVRIGLDGVSDQRIGKAAKRPLEPLRLPPHTRAGVDVDGRSHRSRNRRKRNLLAVDDAVPQAEGF
jgi:hypothetical protein